MQAKNRYLICEINFAQKLIEVNYKAQLIEVLVRY